MCPQRSWREYKSALPERSRYVEIRHESGGLGASPAVSCGAAVFSYAKIGFVKILFKSLLVWFMLLAVPLQGFASATTLLCAPPGTASGTHELLLRTGAPAHDHQAMLLARHADDMHAAGADMTSAGHSETSGKASSSHDAGGNCNACSACCVGAAMAPSPAMRVPVEAQQFTVIPFDSGVAPAVDLALPERPPQASLT